MNRQSRNLPLLLSVATGLAAGLLNAGETAGDCVDAYDNNGSAPDSLAAPSIISQDTLSIERSLCGFYAADHTLFPALANTTYHVEVRNHSAPQGTGLYIQVYEKADDDSYTAIARTNRGQVTLDFTTGNRALEHIVRISSTASETGKFGGGNYTLIIEARNTGS